MSAAPGGDGPLAGLFVVSLEQAVAAPYCACKLADAGARVVKIERPEGDFARGYDRLAKGESAYFVWLNRGKESAVVDIKDPDDLAFLKAMIAKADVFIQNLAPGAAARAGLGSADLRAARRELICVDISGYGEDGPYRDMKAYDLLIQAESGLCAITGTPDEPGRVGVSVCDVACGMYAYQAVLEALIQRGRTGEGRAIKVSLFAAMADWMTVPLLQTQYGAKAPKRVGLAHPTIAPYGAFPAADGRPVLISIQNEREWRRLCAHVLERPEMADDPRFADNSARIDNRAALDGAVAAVFATQDSATLAARLKTAGIAYGLLNDTAALIAHPQLRRRPATLPSGEAINLVAPPAAWDGQAEAFGRVPGLGEHTKALRLEFGE
ncbi:MAG: CaiB/BaiF CoA-transferase family protein [Marivibrio sp.]|uniref:CaiB/BaiF CoA transferase family protein n=1 Tax=Marivibrio sp. TaxID=2039719 RepID=UPI0032EB7460